ncbi:hypothetical protein GCM10027614_83440 [Micromonospora vulcania]
MVILLSLVAIGSWYASAREVIENFSSIQQDIFMTAYATYVCELLDKATEERQPNPYLYELTFQILRDINEGYDPQILTQILK